MIITQSSSSRPGNRVQIVNSLREQLILPGIHIYPGVAYLTFWCGKTDLRKPPRFRPTMSWTIWISCLFTCKPPTRPAIEAIDDYRIMVASDHFTPISMKTHAMDPAPFTWASKDELSSRTSKLGFSERNARESGIVYRKGYKLMPAFLSRIQPKS